MRLLTQIRHNPLQVIGLLLIATLIVGTFIYARRSATPEEYAVYAATINADSTVRRAPLSGREILLYRWTLEGEALDADVADYVDLEYTDSQESSIRLGQVTFMDNGTTASVRIGYPVCGSNSEYLVRYHLSKNIFGWHVDGQPELSSEVFC
jgi:hypothetical protein